MKSNEASSIGCDASVFRDQFRDLEKKIRFALSGEPLYLATDSTLKFSGAEDATLEEAIECAKNDAITLGVQAVTANYPRVKE